MFTDDMLITLCDNCNGNSFFFFDVQSFDEVIRISPVYNSAYNKLYLEGRLTDISEVKSSLQNTNKNYSFNDCPDMKVDFLLPGSNVAYPQEINLSSHEDAGEKHFLPDINIPGGLIGLEEHGVNNMCGEVSFKSSNTNIHELTPENTTPPRVSPINVDNERTSVITITHTKNVHIAGLLN